MDEPKPLCRLCFDKGFLYIEKESGQEIRGMIEDWNFTFGWNGPITRESCPACNGSGSRPFGPPLEDSIPAEKTGEES